MIKVAFPEPAFRFKKENGKEFIFDTLRKKWLRLTPEEWVRQNFLQYLIQSLAYPSSLIALEKSISLGELTKRFDILVYDTQHQPWMMIECKGADIPVTPAVLEQVLRYNISVPVPYLVITNGATTYAWDRQTQQMLEQLPPHS